MKKNLLILKLSFLLVLSLVVFNAGAQKIGKIHIKISGTDKKIDTVIEFKDDLNAEQIQEIISTITGEDVDVSVKAKSGNKMIWISDDDMKGDFEFHFDMNIDSMMENVHKNMKMYNFNSMNKMTDSMLEAMDIKMDSFHNFYFSGDENFEFKWHGNDSMFDEDIFIFKGDSIFTNIDSLMKGSKIMMKSHVFIDDNEDGGRVRKIVIITDDDGDHEIHKYMYHDKDENIDKRGKKTIRIEIDVDEKDIE